MRAQRVGVEADDHRRPVQRQVRPKRPAEEPAAAPARCVVAQTARTRTTSRGAAPSSNSPRSGPAWASCVASARTWQTRVAGRLQPAKGARAPSANCPQVFSWSGLLLAGRPPRCGRDRRVRGSPPGRRRRSPPRLCGCRGLPSILIGRPSTQVTISPSALPPRSIAVAKRCGLAGHAARPDAWQRRQYLVLLPAAARQPGQRQRRPHQLQPAAAVNAVRRSAGRSRRETRASRKRAELRRMSASSVQSCRHTSAVPGFGVGLPMTCRAIRRGTRCCSSSRRAARPALGRSRPGVQSIAVTNSRGRRCGSGLRWHSRHQPMLSRSTCCDLLHLVDPAVARDAADAARNVGVMVEIDVVGQVVDLDPADGRRRSRALAQHGSLCAVGGDCLVAVHADLGRRDGRKGGLSRPWCGSSGNPMPSSPTWRAWLYATGCWASSPRRSSLANRRRRAERQGYTGASIDKTPATGLARFTHGGNGGLIVAKGTPPRGGNRSGPKTTTAGRPD